jgi:hypothetical protein
MPVVQGETVLKRNFDIYQCKLTSILYYKILEQSYK